MLDSASRQAAHLGSTAPTKSMHAARQSLDEIAVEEEDDIVGQSLVGDRGEVAHVAEQHRDHLLVAGRARTVPSTPTSWLPGSCAGSATATGTAR